MLNLRALLYAAVPGVIVFLAFGYWIGVPLPYAVAAAAVFTLAILYLTRVVHEEPEEELAAWRAAAPDLVPVHEPASSGIAGVGSEARPARPRLEDAG